MPQASPPPWRLALLPSPPPLPPRLSHGDVRYINDNEASPCDRGRLHMRASEANNALQGPSCLQYPEQPKQSEGRCVPSSEARTTYNQGLLQGQRPEATLEKSSRKARAEVASLTLKIQNLERAQRRYRRQVQEKTENLKDMRVEVEETRLQLALMEEKMDEAKAKAGRLSTELNRYRAWWLTEYHSLQALLGLVPDRRSVEAIASSAEDRFRVYYGTLST
ncbi:hypothetical protein FA13DRAFT_1796333 [Coprinellus micaceus]|uniref:Uncharacterized protein n=1 Tax=Coprinellus micaceus TaxID=71717 RepID=A0A4Y7SWM6_COPMI|nr:hypothetical protein FA13DRAFT_1796333 [Coprinellus micaceus]